MSKRDIIPFDPEGSKSLIPAGDIDKARRSFEAPQREITLSETYNYYSSSSVGGVDKARAWGLIPALQAKLPSLLTKYNTLEAARRKAGGDKGRKQLEAAIDGMLSFGEGLKKLRERQKAVDPEYHLTKLIRASMVGSKTLVKAAPVSKTSGLPNDEDLLEHGFHDITTSLTSEETAWVSVIKKIPMVVFNHRPSSVPAIVEYFCDGVEWALDTLPMKEHSDTPRDTFDALGITGIRHDSSFSKFIPKFELGLKGLYYAMVADSQIFDRCLEDLAGPALLSGDGKILRAMAENDGKTFSDEYALKNRHRINEFLSSIVLVSAIKMEIISGLELVTLVGMLDRMPQLFFQRKGLVFIPSGKGLMFLDPATFEELHYSPFDSYVAHVAQNEIYHSSNAIDRANPVWDIIFHGIRERIRRKNAAEGNLSTLEKVADGMSRKYGIKVEIGIKRYLQNKAILSLVGQTSNIAYTVKMGHWDLLCVDEILSKIPLALLGGVKKIERVAHGGDPYSNMITGVFHAGSYSARNKTLELVIPPLDDDIPSEVLGVSGLSYSFTIAHETGHSVHLFNPDLWERWRKISKARKNFPISRRRSEFLSAYASTSKEEDFAETFASYIMMPVEFRRLAVVYPSIRRKYEFMKSVFEGREFSLEVAESLDDVRGPITFDFGLRERLLRAEDKVLKGPLSKEVSRRMELSDKKARHKPLEGPRVLPAKAAEEPGKVESSPDPREEPRFLGYDHYDMVKVLGGFLHRILGSKYRFVDVQYLELRLLRKDYEMAALDIANSLGIDRAQAGRIVQRCRWAMEGMQKADQEVAEELKNAERKKEPGR